MEKPRLVPISSSNYSQDTIFDIIDVRKQITRNKEILKCSNDEFLYNILQSNTSSKYNFNVEDIKIENEYGKTSKLTEQFTIKNKLGEGSFGLVLNVYDHILKINAALKIIKKENFNSYKNEWKHHQNIQNHNIVKYYRAFENNEFLFIVMELMEGGTLKELIMNRYKREEYFFYEEECATIMRGIANSIDYLHFNNLIHRDVKPENIMFKRSNNLETVKLLDMGLVLHNENYFNKNRSGTPIYMAPELASNKQYDRSVDIWAAGFILYILLSGGKHPLLHKKQKIESYYNLLQLTTKWKFPKSFPTLGRNLFLKMCKVDYHNRYESYKVLIHPWITRKTNAPIPLTMMESWKKRTEINKFKAMMILMIFFSIYKKEFLGLKVTKIPVKILKDISLSPDIRKNKLDSQRKITKNINSSNLKASIESPTKISLISKIHITTSSKSSGQINKDKLKHQGSSSYKCFSDYYFKKK